MIGRRAAIEPNSDLRGTAQTILLSSSAGIVRAVNATTSYPNFVCDRGDCSGTWGPGVPLADCQSACVPPAPLYKCVPSIHHEKCQGSDSGGVSLAECQAMCIDKKE